MVNSWFVVPGWIEFWGWNVHVAECDVHHLDAVDVTVAAAEAVGHSD